MRHSEIEEMIDAELSLIVAMRDALPGLVAEVQDGRGADAAVVRRR